MEFRDIVFGGDFGGGGGMTGEVAPRGTSNQRKRRRRRPEGDGGNMNIYSIYRGPRVYRVSQAKPPTPQHHHHHLLVVLLLLFMGRVAESANSSPIDAWPRNAI